MRLLKMCNGIDDSVQFRHPNRGRLSIDSGMRHVGVNEIG